LKYNISDKFNIEEGIKINFNFPVTKEELEDKLSLFNNKKEVLNIIIEKLDDNNNRYSIKLKDDNFTYDTKYKIYIDK